MNKINFVNNSAPDLSAETLNQIQNNMEEVGVAVSSTEPTTNEKVWLQKGKNLFNKNGDLLLNARLDSGTSHTYVADGYITSHYIDVLPNTSYSLQGINVYHLYDENKEKITQNFYSGDSNDIITTTANTKYIRVSTLDINQLMVSKGSIVTEYEPYVERKINVKNDNGVYEEFYDESKMNKTNYSTVEQVIGTWIDGKPLYRKVVEDISINNNGNMLVPTNITNANIICIDAIIQNAEKTASFVVPYCVGEQYLYINTSNNGTEIYIRTNDTWDGFSLIIVLEYTKTTDA